MNTIKLYLHAARMLLKSHLQYPASFCLQTLAQIVMQSGELLAVLLIIRRFDGLNQWTGGNLLFFFGVVNVTWYLTEFLFRGVTCLGALVQAGTLDVFLLRPRGVITQAICHQLDPRRIGTMAVGMAALAMGARQSAVQWTLLRALALTEGVVMGAIMILGLFLLEGMLCIHTVKSIEMVNTLTYGGRSACQYPIDIYPRPLKLLFMIVAPFGLTFHAPIAYILNKNLFGWPDYCAFLCPLAGLASFGVMYALFQRAMRFYRSTGS